MFVWLEFGVCVAVILVTGTNLARLGDVLAEKTQLGRTWVGVVLLASVTSLAELVTGISSVAIFDLPDIAAGDVLGSCMFNILILALADALYGSKPLTANAHSGHVLSATFGVVLLGLVAMSILAGPRMPQVGWVGATSLLLIALYLLGMYLIFRHERNRGITAEEVQATGQYVHLSTRRAVGLFCINALFIVGAATWLPHLAEQIAKMTGLGQTFVGNLFVAASTSLPEVVVTLAAARMGAFEMVLGNLFGSNLFNIGILAVDDVFFLPGPLLAHVSPTQIVPTVAAMTMTAIAMIGLTYRSQRAVFRLGWDSLGIIGVFAGATTLLYWLTR